MSGAGREATAELAERFCREGLSRDAYRVLGRTGWTVSAVGFGGYRVDDRTAEHREALNRALARGCNLIDTSTNYTDGGSERCVGEVLDHLARRGELRREETVLVSKIGYVQGSNLKLARERERAGDPFPEMVKVSPGCWHCIHPRFLEDQLGRSLARLRQDRLDVCLLHNPEYFLEDASRAGQTGGIEAARSQFYARIRAAFAWLEEEVRRGRIAWYGVSSNTFGLPAGEGEATSLGGMLESARQAAAGAGLPPEDHHFAVAQLPLNLCEHAPLTVRKEGEKGDLTTLACAAKHGVGVLVNRPLNAFTGGELIRLADFRTDPPNVPPAKSLERVAALEKEFLETIGGHLRLGSDGPRPSDLFPWGHRLAPFLGGPGREGGAGGYEQWQAFQEQRIHPHLYQVISFLQSSLPGEKGAEFRDWFDRYLPELGELLSGIRAECAARSQKRSDRIRARIDPGLPPALRDETLSRKSLHAVASLDGVTCVLNGMRHPLYVDDSLRILRWDRLPAAEKLFGRL